MGHLARRSPGSEIFRWLGGAGEAREARRGAAFRIWMRGGRLAD
jgi:hypothetical protein